MILKTMLIVLMTISTVCFAALPVPQDAILANGIIREENLGMTHTLDEYKLTNNYTLTQQGEEYITLEYVAAFKLKPEWANSQSMQGQPTETYRQGKFSMVIRGNSWYYFE